MNGKPTVRPAAPAKVRQDNIDLLRAIAVLGVIAYHYTSRFPADFYHYDTPMPDLYVGRLGVDLFFVVSGYCLLMTLDRAERLERFWAGRLARIQPAYMAAVLLTFLVVTAFGLPDREVGVLTAASNLVWLQVLPDWKMVDGAYWSLVVELKFYFWIGLTYYLLQGRNVSTAWLAFSAVGIVAWHAQMAGLPMGGLLNIFAEYVLIAPYAPEFLVGLIAYESRRLSRRCLTWLLCGAAVLVILSPRFAGSELVGLSLCAFAFAVLKIPGMRVPRPITFIGLISYPLYLVHQNIGYVLIRELAELVPSDVPRIAVSSLLVLLLAILLSKTVELRWQKRLGDLLDRKLRPLLGLLPLPVVRRPVPELGPVREW